MPAVYPPRGTPEWDIPLREYIDAKAAAGRSPLGAWYAALSRRDITPAVQVFLGSSTTYGLAATNPFFRYTYRLHRMMQDAYPSGIPDYEKPMVNVGNGYPTRDLMPGVQSYVSAAGGQTSRNYVNSVNRPFVNFHRPALVHHMIGSNDSTDLPDYAVPVEEYEENVANAIDSLDAGQTEPISHVLWHSFRRSSVTIPHWMDYLAALHRIASTRPNVLVVDISEEFERLDHMGSDPYDVISTDGVHMTDAGHAFMADLMAKALAVPVLTGPSPRLHFKATFQQPDGAPTIDLPVGGTWTPLGSAAATVVDRRLTLTTAGTVVTDIGLSDLEYDGVITYGTGTSTLPGLVFRCSDDSNRMGLFLNPASALVMLYKTQAGATSILKQTSRTLGSSGTYRLKVVASGDMVYGYVNGEKYIEHQMTTAEMTALGSNTKIGVRNNSLAVPTSWWGLQAHRL